MKKFITTSILCLMTICTFAQDIIITIDEQKINAKVIEVSKTEIRYKELDNLEGPTFILPIEDIKQITYSNGKTVIYSVNATEDAKSNNQASTEYLDIIYLLNGEQKRVKINNISRDGVTYEENGRSLFIKSEEVEKVHFSNGQIKTYNKPSNKLSSQSSIPAINATVTTEEPVSQSNIKMGESRIYRERNEYMYNNTYISGKEVKRILQNQDPVAYEQWRKADGLVVGSGVCVGVGLGLVIGGIFPIIWGDFGTAIGLECSALVPLGVGLGLALGASGKYNKAIDIYNSKYDNASIQLNVFASPSGVGLALAF